MDAAHLPEAVLEIALDAVFELLPECHVTKEEEGRKQTKQLVACVHPRCLGEARDPFSVILEQAASYAW